MTQFLSSRRPVLGAMLLALIFMGVFGAAAASAQVCERNLTAKVVAIDQPYFWNRLGAVQPHGMMYALERDVVRSSNEILSPLPGDAKLRRDKRPRPLTLRMNVGDCLTVRFKNMLRSTPADEEQVATREASVHVTGMQLVETIDDDGSFVGKNTSSLAAPGGTRFYTFYAEREGTYLLHSNGALIGGEGDNGHISAGLFGAVNVEPRGSIWYRSQVTRQEIDWATQEDEKTGGPALTPGGHPILNYGAVYPLGHKFAGTPILEMLSGNEVIHSDLTAIIAGTGTGGRIVPDPYAGKEVYVVPERNKPFREFTIIFHDEIAAVQAFPQFQDKVLSHTLHSVRDAFAINYGTGGIGAEILANRIGVGPMAECTECLYEEFFLSAWAVGDPAMIVDKPANAPCSTSDLRQEWDERFEAPPCTPDPGFKATKAFYPDDPSNVYHSYLNDHVKYRNLLAGSDDHHIFHLHAHQWLHTPDSDNSTYLDSQAIGQGTAFTYEIAHEGSGNRNKTPGDSIFHCHFYPHFAQGMWAMWRVHDVFEHGTKLDEGGRPILGPNEEIGVVNVATRALPDAEIDRGSPIPALVPLPGQPMPPMPEVQVGLKNGQVSIAAGQTGNPGYPFFIPGVAGHRPPHPPLDFYKDGSGVVHDGGLPRHIITDGTFHEEHTRLSFEKGLLTADARELKETGEPWELEAMAFHADAKDGVNDGFLATFTPEGSPASFEVNGAPAIGGAPYADPCLGGRTTPPPQGFRTYKAANIEMDVVFNKEGWHFPQQRFISLWEDVDDFLDFGKPPEPFFFRANSNDCITYLHTNLVPKEYELDDFQVRTPTDVLGQHIHLVKFDVTASDGGGNGFNYEDGTFSPEEVLERIKAINAFGGIVPANPASGARVSLTAKAHPFFAGRKEGEGAQTTIQRWYADEVLNHFSKDRTLRTVFTHDHFGPSTHQQTGLYAGLVVEPAGSQWFHNETGVQLGTRHDGGPTTWQATIEAGGEDDTFREFLFEFGDFQHAYWPGSPTVPHPELGFASPELAINPPGRKEFWNQLQTGKPWIYEKPAVHGQGCPGGVAPPCPEAVSAADPGTMVVNYRNEPLALRVHDPATGGQALGKAGDMAHVYSSKIQRQRPNLNTVGPQPLTEDARPTDPYTPLLRAYENDRVQIRILVGSHEEEHNFSVDGVRWLYEPSDPNSGFRASQMMGISEHFEFEIPNLPKGAIANQGFVDFLYKAGASVDDQWNGLWGIVRTYRTPRPDLRTLSTNARGSAPDLPPGDFNGVCPKSAPVRTYDVTAIAAKDILSKQTLIYNSRATGLRDCQENTVAGTVECRDSGLSGPLHDPAALMFVRTSDLVTTTDSTGATVKRLAPGQKAEPLILRANSGECIEVTLRNALTVPPHISATFPPLDLLGYSLLPNIVDEFNANQVLPSMEVGLHAQLLEQDITRSSGVNVGFNPTTTVPPGKVHTYRWYAGALRYDPIGDVLFPVDIEFGSLNLTSADPIKHSNKGLVGGLIVEPKFTAWREDPGSHAEAWVDYVGGPIRRPSFREQVLVYQDDVNLRYENWQPVRPTAIMEDPAETGQDAVNYKTEPAWFRKAYLPQTKPGATRHFTDLADTFSNVVTGGKDPETPVFDAAAGTPVRLRLLHPGGHSQNNTFGIHGHVWEEEPYTQDSEVLGSNPLSEWKGSQHGHGPGNHFDVIPAHGAGGAFRVTGDYMWRDYVPWYLANGIWGIFRVHSPGAAIPPLSAEEPAGSPSSP